MVNRQRNPLVRWFLFCLVLIPLAAVSDQTQAEREPHTIKLMVLGDSLSAAYGLKAHEGWVSLLQNMWQENQSGLEIVNAAISGKTKDGGLAR